MSRRQLLVAVVSLALCRETPALAQAPGDAQVESEARGQAAEADRLFKNDEFAAALPLYQAERVSRKALGDQRYEAYATRAIGCCHERLNELDAAITAWRAAATLDAKRDDRGFEGYDLLLIGRALLLQEKTQEAVDTLQQALPLLSQAVDRDHEADGRLIIAHALTNLGQPEKAGTHLDRSLMLAQSLGDDIRTSNALSELGLVALAMDDPAPAAEWLTDARAAFAAQGRLPEAARADRLLGDAFLALDRNDSAFARVERASQAHEQLEDHASLAEDLQFLSAMRAREGDLKSAIALAKRVVQARAADDDPTGEIDALIVQSRCEGRAENWTAAASTLDQALRLVRLHGVPAEQVRLLILAAEVDARTPAHNQGPALLSEAQTIADRSDNGALKRLVADAKLRLPARGKP